VEGLQGCHIPARDEGLQQYVEGDTLQQLIDRNGLMPPEVAAECVAQAAAGLQHAHEKGFVHRDIKPANLIRDRFGVVKILDMGLARSGSDRDKLTEVLDEGAVVGTADYISPEQAINCPSVDARADIYSLGATLFTLVVGKTPFEGNTTQKLMQHQLRNAPPLRDLNPNVPEELADVVARMLAKKPAERYQSAAEVIAALTPWAAGSARVLAGVSRTNLGRADIQVTLSDRALSGSSLRLRDPFPSGSGSSSDALRFDTAEAAKATAALSAAETARSHQPANLPSEGPTAAPPPRSHTALILGIAAAMLVVGVLIGWLAFGR
jgi:serine/threonine protein kinase